MILIGQYNSPFVRRVALALRLYGLPYEQRPWSTFGDAEKLAAFNPLRRVPTLVLDGGEVLIESGAILDHLDELVGPDKAMIAESGPARRHALENLRAGQRARRQGGHPDLRAGAAQGAAQMWVERCQAQIGGVLDVLEKERAAVATPFWFGDRIGHADIMVACALRFTGEAHPALLPADALSGADGARRALRGAAAVSGDRAEARSAEGVSSFRGTSIPCGAPAAPALPAASRTIWHPSEPSFEPPATLARASILTDEAERGRSCDKFNPSGKISLFPKGNQPYNFARLTRQEGRLAIVTKRAVGCGGRGCAFDERRGCGRRNRVVLTPQAGVKSGEASRGDGGKRHGSPGRARISRKTTAQGRPDASAEPVCSCAPYTRTLLHTRPRVQRAPGLPCALSNSRANDLRKLRAHPPRETRSRVCSMPFESRYHNVIAGALATKQSSFLLVARDESCALLRSRSQ